MSSSFPGRPDLPPDPASPVQPDLPPEVSPQQSPNPGAADLVALAATLQQLARSLLALAQSGPESGAAQQGQAARASTDGLPCEIRVYSLAEYIVKEEKALLAAYHAEDWQEMFYMARNKLEIIYNLMSHFDEDEEISGFFLQQIARDLMAQPLEMLTRLCSLVADFRAPEAGEI